jgi:hypothetical protein
MTSCPILSVVVLSRRMSATNQRERSPLAALVSIGVGVLGPAAYVLSTGPAYWLMGHGYAPDWLDNVYLPLALIATFLPPFGQAIDRWVLLWTT